MEPLKKVPEPPTAGSFQEWARAVTPERAVGALSNTFVRTTEKSTGPPAISVPDGGWGDGASTRCAVRLATSPTLSSPSGQPEDGAGIERHVEALRRSTAGSRRGFVIHTAFPGSVVVMVSAPKQALSVLFDSWRDGADVDENNLAVLEMSPVFEAQASGKAAGRILRQIAGTADVKAEGGGSASADQLYKLNDTEAQSGMMFLAPFAVVQKAKEMKEQRSQS
jgi:hypothetical protein